MILLFGYLSRYKNPRSKRPGDFLCGAFAGDENIHHAIASAIGIDAVAIYTGKAGDCLFGHVRKHHGIVVGQG